MKLPALSGYVLWLLPDEASGTKLRKIIQKLANKYDSHSFEPHITIGGVPGRCEAELASALQRVTSKITSFKIVLSKVECGTSPYQKITIKTESTSNLLSISDSIDHQFKGVFGKRDNFHLSMFYGIHDCEGFGREMDLLEKEIPAEILITRIALAEINGLPDSWKVIKAYEF